MTRSVILREPFDYALDRLRDRRISTGSFANAQDDGKAVNFAFCIMTPETKIQDFESIVLKLASPEEILSWSHGEVTKPETINYRTAKPERDGLFDERIFGPTKDYECYCGKYRRIRYKGIICDKCGVEVTRAIVRRERMGHIQLASPVSHIWFLRGVPSKIGLILDMSVVELEKVIYFGGYVIVSVDEGRRRQALEDIEREFKAKSKNAPRLELERLKTAKEKAKEEVSRLKLLTVLSEVEYHRLSLKYGDAFGAKIGAEAVWEILKAVNFEKLEDNLEAELIEAPPAVKKKYLKRLKLVRGMLKARIRPEWMFLTALPVIPPDLRPMVPLDGGRYASSDLNDLYRRVINRNNRLKRLFELKAPEVIIRNEKRMLQEAVDALIDNSSRRGQSPVASQIQRRPLKSLADILKGKQGRFRQNLLGKRVDYSGRSVIVVGPELKLHQCGLPKEMALELFKPFVIRKLIQQEIAHNIRGAGHLIEERTPEVWAFLEEVIEEGRVVLLNRAPTLHRLGIQAFQPVLIEGLAIQVHPLVCPPFNADFDGDQMAVHVPLTEEAQREARELMLSTQNLLKPATGEPIVMPTKDMILGVYWATFIQPGEVSQGRVFSDETEAVLAYDFGLVDLRSRIRVRIQNRAIVSFAEKEKSQIQKDSSQVTSAPSQIIETSVGRILFNRVLPEDYPFINRELKSKDLEELGSDFIRRYGIKETPPILDRIKGFGFRHATKSGISWSINDLVVPPEKEELIKKAESVVETIFQQYQRGLLTEKERYDRVIEVWSEVNSKIRELVPKTLDPFGSVSTIIGSKARGTWLAAAQMSGMKGLVVNPAGKIIDFPVLSSYKEGLNTLEYFISTHGARKGTADTALKTAVAGYLTRRLVDVTQDVIISEKDCGITKGITVFRADSEEVGRPFNLRVWARISLQDIKDGNGEIIVKNGEIIGREHLERIESAKEISSLTVRSPLTCRGLDGICQNCYGLDLGRNEVVGLGEAVGIVAAQSIGEPGTQLTMRTFHTGGVAGGGDITSGLPRVEEIFEVRPPKGKAVISDADAKVIDISTVNREKIIKVELKSELTPEPKAKGLLKLKKVVGRRKSIATVETKEFRIPPGVGLFAEIGKELKKGDILCEGHADLHELFRAAGRELTERYVIKEVQKIYSLQGAPIHDKHIEVIVRQMFSRVRIKDPGESHFTSGEIVEKTKFRQENHRLNSSDKKPATAVQMLLGITKVALSAESFLSAASFQETARVLINAAVEGREDKLRGLKENVIIGRLIPAGTGYKKQ